MHGGPSSENEGEAESQTEAEPQCENVPKVLDYCQDGSSRSPDNEKDACQAVLSASALSDFLQDYGSDHKEQGNYADAVPAEDVIYECGKAHNEKNYKGKTVDSPLFEIPLRHPSICPDEMATVSVSNIVGIDPKPFDPSTYVEEDFFVMDASGFKRRIPSNNIIRWRNVTNPDGTTAVESNTRFVTWSDESLQLFIGNEGFDVSEQDAKEIQSHIFLKHTKGIYQSQGRISRKMKFMPSSLSSTSHRLLTALVDSRNKKVNKVKQYITDVDKEREIEKMEKAEKQISKANKLLNEKKKKIASKYTPKGGCKGSQIFSDFLEDASDEVDYEAHHSTALHHLELDQEKEATARKRLTSAKKGPKFRDQSTSSINILTRGTLPFSAGEKAESEHGCEGQEFKGSLSHGKIKKMQEAEEETVLEDSEGDVEMNVRQEPKAKGKESQSRLKKQYIESDEDSPPRRITTGRQMANMDDSSEE